MRKKQRLLLFISLIAASQALVSSLYRPLLPQYGAAIGLSATLIGIIVSAFALLPLFFSVPAGAVIDRLGARPVIVVGYISLAANGVLLWAVHSTIALVGTQVVAGLGQMLIVVATQTYVSTLGSGRDRENNFGTYAFALSAGQLGGPIIGGALADHLGFRPTFLISGLVAIGPLVGALFLSEVHERAPIRRVGSSVPALSKLGGLLQREGIKAAIVASFSVIFAMGVRGTFFPVYLVGIGFSATTIGVILSARAFASMAVRPFMSRVISLVGRRRLLLVSMFSGAISILCIPLAHTFLPLALLSVLGGMGTGFTQPLTLLSVSDQTAEEDRGLALGLRMMGNRLANFTNPLMFGLIAEQAGLGMAFACAGILLIGAATVLLQWRGVFTSERGYVA